MNDFVVKRIEDSIKIFCADGYGKTTLRGPRCESETILEHLLQISEKMYYYDYYQCDAPYFVDASDPSYGKMVKTTNEVNKRWEELVALLCVAVGVTTENLQDLQEVLQEAK